MPDENDFTHKYLRIRTFEMLYNAATFHLFLSHVEYGEGLYCERGGWEVKSLRGRHGNAYAQRNKFLKTRDS